MRLTRARLDGRVVLARLDGDVAHVVWEESDHVAADALREALAADADLSGEGRTVGGDELTTLSPVAAPSKVVCVGLNYSDHAEESGAALPTKPMLFAKFANAIVGTDEHIEFDAAELTEVDYEGELAVVIGKRASNVPLEQALDHVFGYTVANDVSARDAQFSDGQWVRGKSSDTFCPLGPVIVTADEITDPQQLGVSTRLNGEVMQDGSTSKMVFAVDAIVAYASRFITLLPGDVILTGTPPGVGFARTPPVFLGDGDTVEVEIERIGTLRSRVRCR